MIGAEIGASVAQNLLKGFENVVNIKHIHKYYFFNLIIADPDDNKYVDCAIASRADFIVTDDKHFNILKQVSFPKVKVISADDFVEMLTGIRPVKRI